MKTHSVAIVTADSHCWNNTWKRHQNLQGDSYASMFQIGEISHVYNLPILMAGDIFDKKTLYSEVLEQTTSALVRGNFTKMFYIQGNHDLSNTPWFTSLHDDRYSWIHKTIACVSEADEIYAVGIDFQYNQEYLQEQLNDIAVMVEKHKEKNNLSDDAKYILLLHQTCTIFMGTLIDCQLKDNMIPECIDLVILGDYHVTKVSSILKQNNEEVMVISPGSTCMQNIAEDSKKYVILLEYTDKKEFKPGLIKLLTRPFELKTISNIDEIPDMIDDLNEKYTTAKTTKKYAKIPSIERPVARINIVSPNFVNKDTLENEITEKLSSIYELFFRYFEGTTKLADDNGENTGFGSIEDLQLDPAKSCLVALDNFINKNEKPELYNLVTQMLTSDVPDMTLYDFRTEYLGKTQQ